MLTLYCNKDKYLSVVSNVSYSFEDENKAIKIVVNIAPICCGYDISACKVNLYISAPGDNIHSLPLTFTQADGFCTASSWFTLEHTEEAGLCKMWLDINDYKSGSILKSSVITTIIKTHRISTDYSKRKDLSEAIAEAKYSAEEAKNHAFQALETAAEIHNIVTKTPYIKDGYWYVYNQVTKEYEQSVYAGGNSVDIVVDDYLSEESKNPVENQAITKEIIEIHESVTDLYETKLDASKLRDVIEPALAGKQDVIPENTYDAHGASAQALSDAKAYVDEEDIFVTDMKTINALGGIAAGSDLNNLTTHEVLKKLLYPYVDATVGNATATPNGGTYEKGATKTITQVSISITKKSEPITSVALYNGSTLIEEKTGDAVKNGGTITFSGLRVVVPTNGNQLTVKVTYPDANGAAKTVEKKTTALTFVYPYYMGTCAAGTAINETLVESLTKKIESKGNKSNSFTVSDGHMVFAYPKAHGVLKSILDPNNFETIGNYTRSEVRVTGLDGTAQTYYVYVSGATTVSGFTVNFKY